MSINMDFPVGFNIGNINSWSDKIDSTFNKLGLNLGSFGNVVFEANRIRTRTYSDFRRDFKANFVKHNIVQRKPVLEATGLDLTVISFKIRFNTTNNVVPVKEVNKLIDMLESQREYPLIMGRKVLGKYVIENLSDGWIYVDNFGNVLVAEAELNLLESVPLTLAEEVARNANN